MSNHKKTTNSLSGALIILGACTLLTIFFLIQNYFFSLYSEKPFEFFRNIWFQATYIYPWGLLFITLHPIIKNFKLERDKLKKNLLILVFIGIITSIVHRTIFVASFTVVIAPEKFFNNFPFGFSSKI